MKEGRLPLAVVVLLACLEVALLGQAEAPSIAFDPREEGYSLSSWQSLLGHFIVGFALYGFWRGFTWLIERRREKTNWRRLRHFLPTTMLVLAWLMLGIGDRISPQEDSVVFDLLTLVFVIVDLPAIVVFAVLAQCFDGITPWERPFVSSLCLWFVWYAILGFAEWRAWAYVPVSLDINQRHELARIASEVF